MEHKEHKESNQPAATTHNNNVLMAILAYLGVLILIPLILDARKDPFVKYHLRQGLVLVVFEIITWVIAAIPLGFLISWILSIITLVFIIIGMLNAAQGKEQELPFIGMYAKNFNW